MDGKSTIKERGVGGSDAKDMKKSIFFDPLPY